MAALRVDLFFAPIHLRRARGSCRHALSTKGRKSGIEPAYHLQQRVLNTIYQGWTNCGSLSFPKNYRFVYNFLFLLQSVEILSNGTLAASVPESITFASRSKKKYVTEA